MTGKQKSALGRGAFQKRKTPCLWISARGADNSHGENRAGSNSLYLEGRREQADAGFLALPADCILQFADGSPPGIQLRDSAGLEPAFPVGSANIHIQFAVKVSTGTPTCQMSKIINERRFMTFVKL
jgi:hypothetical protein